MRPRARRRAYGALAVAVAVLWAFPVYWMVNSAFFRATGSGARSRRSSRCPETGQLRRVFDNGGFISALRISLTVTV